MKTKIYALIACALIALPACDSEEEATPQEEPAEQEVVEEVEEVEEPEVEEEVVELHPIWGAWSPDSDLEALQGEWITVWGPDDEEQTRWKIDGIDATYTQKGGEPQEGTIELEHPGALRFSYEVGGGTQGRITTFTREGDEIYAGLGMGGVVLEDRLVMRSSNNLIVYKDGGCTYHKSSMMRGFDEDGEEISCEVVEENDERYFTFTTPDDREISIDQRIRVGEHSLADNQLRSSLLQRVE